MRSSRRRGHLLQKNAHSADCGRGARRVQSPTLSRGHAGAAEVSSDDGGFAYMSLRVYLVEDSAIVLERLRQSMQENGVTVLGHAGDAMTAIAEIADLHPDVVIVDIALREGTGFHVLKDIDGLPGLRRPTRVVLTNFTGDWYRDGAKRLGADYFFDKSSQIPEMLDALRKISPPASDAVSRSRANAASTSPLCRQPQFAGNDPDPSLPPLGQGPRCMQ